MLTTVSGLQLRTQYCKSLQERHHKQHTQQQQQQRTFLYSPLHPRALKVRTINSRLTKGVIISLELFPCLRKTKKKVTKAI